MSRSTVSRAVVLLLIAAMALEVFCVQAGALQYVNLPKYDIELSADPAVADAGGSTQVTAHVVLMYHPMGTDPSVPNIYVECELKGPSGTVVATANGVTDSAGIFRAEMAVPQAPGEYSIVARAYDVAGGAVNGQNEAPLGVRPAAAVTAVPATPTPPAAATPAATPIAPTTMPTAAPVSGKPLVGGLLGSTELLLIAGAVIILLVIGLLIVAAIVAFFLLRRKKKTPPVKPADPAPAAAPAPAPAPAPQAPQTAPAAEQESKRFCMHCGAPMGMYVSNCTSCGQAPPSGVDTKECPNCHNVLPESAKFCNRCGSVQPENSKK